ncbi:argonaute 5 [Ancistrocladus abbreviatus]
MDWPEVTKYKGLVFAQGPGQETIQVLYKVVRDPLGGVVPGGMIRYQFDGLCPMNSALVSVFNFLTVVFFAASSENCLVHSEVQQADGISEGQFSQVLLEEMDAIRKACTSLQEGYKPRVTFVVVQKRNHTRLFATDRNMTDRSGNILPGSILYIDPSETLDEVLLLILRSTIPLSLTSISVAMLAFSYARCTRSVCMVPPAYYAHLAAFRAHYYIEGDAPKTKSSSGGEMTKKKTVEASPNRRGSSSVRTTVGPNRNAEVVVAGGGLDNPNRIADSPERTPEVQREQDAIEDPFIAEDNPNRRESSPVRTMVGPNTNAEEDVDGDCLDIPNRIVDSPERMTEVQPEQMSPEICQMHAAKGCRRQVRQKNLEDIMIRSSCPSHKGHRINSMPKHAGIRMPQAAESSRQRSIHTETELGLDVRDSQFVNMNRLNCNTCPPSQSEQQLTPHQIWDFVEHIGVRGNTNLEDVVRRIGDMEQRDWEAFQQFASVGKQNEASKGVSSCK